jgi:hypothetical protein
MVWLWLWSWQAEEAPGFVGDVVEVKKAAALADEIEKIAMLARCRVALMFNCT